MRRALVAASRCPWAAPPIGVFLVLRRMSLMGDALAHARAARRGARLPAGRLLGAGMARAGSSPGSSSRWSPARSRARRAREDASFAALYLVALALGVLIVSMRGGGVDLMHILFGSMLAVDDAALLLIAGDRHRHPAVLAAPTGRWWWSASTPGSSLRGRARARAIISLPGARGAEPGRPPSRRWAR